MWRICGRCPITTVHLFVLGIVPTQAKSTLTLSDSSEKLFADVSQLAVSFEPAHEIDTAVPSAFVLQGHCVKLW